MINDRPNDCVGIVIRVRNAEKDLERCLKEVTQQAIMLKVPIQIIVVDNESTDNSADVARNYNAEILSISQKEFTWGKALNLGISHARSEIVLLISSDVSPANEQWLEQMLTPMNDKNIAAVYARQIPRIDAPIDERARLIKMFPEISTKCNSSNSIQNISGRGMTISNACAAIRRSCWERNVYDEQVEGGEEGLWTIKQLEYGFEYVYNKDAIVFHSHLESPGRFVYRHWELLKKEIRLGNKNNIITAIFYESAALIKRRIINVFIVDAPIQIKLIGLLRLPIEIGLFLFVSFYEMLGGNANKIRRWMWG